MVNFNNFNSDIETQLTSDLSDEIIQLYGIRCQYLPKTSVNLDKIFGEDDLRKFESAFELYLLPDTPESFQGGGDIFGGFGLEILDTMKMYVEISRFQTTTSETQPLEGDLVYIPIFDSWFEITYMDSEGNGSSSSVFYWNGELAVFTLNLMKLQYSHETISTGVDEIDDNLPADSNQTDRDNDEVEEEYVKNGLEDEFEDLLNE